MTFEKRQDFVKDFEGKRYLIGIVELGSAILFIYDFNLKRHCLNGKGFGRECYKDLEQSAKNKGIKEIYGELMKENCDSEGFWKLMGFRIINKNTSEWKPLKEKLSLLFSEDFDSDFIYKKI